MSWAFRLGVLWLLLLTSAHAEHRYGIIIGHNAPPDAARQPLRYVDDDDARFYELLSPGATEIHLLTRFDEPSQRRFPELVARAEAPSLAQLKRVEAHLRGRRGGLCVGHLRPHRRRLDLPERRTLTRIL